MSFFDLSQPHYTSISKERLSFLKEMKMTVNAFTSYLTTTSKKGIKNLKKENSHIDY